ncbi:MAG TPA: Spy/CpxP family protein refolding chaperone, partial [Synergistales bacterium]|nr:Spy/CpxP family protein refolding chaperone [Synergistales bacterium]
EEVEQVKKQLSEGIYQGMKRGYEMGKILTPEQKEQLKEKWGEKKDRMEDRREGARKRFNQRLIDELDLTSEQQNKLDNMKFGPAERGIMAFCEEKLELTDEQVAQIEEIMEKYRPEKDRGFRNFRGEGKDIFGLFSAESFDEARAREMADDQADKMVEGIMNMNRMKAEVLKVLDDDQKEEFEKMMEHRFDHHRPGRDHRWR